MPAGLMLRFGFGTLGLVRIEALCSIDNERSARTLERLGMHREGRDLHACAEPRPQRGAIAGGPADRSGGDRWSEWSRAAYRAVLRGQPSPPITAGTKVVTKNPESTRMLGREVARVDT